jgi:hypothetical protein
LPISSVATSQSRASSPIGVPFEVLDVAPDTARDVYGVDLILVQPDLHVVWRGNRVPSDPRGLARGSSPGANPIA